MDRITQQCLFSKSDLCPSAVISHRESSGSQATLSPAAFAVTFLLGCSPLVNIPPESCSSNISHSQVVHQPRPCPVYLSTRPQFQNCVLMAGLQSRGDTGIIDVLDSRLCRGLAVPKVRLLSVVLSILSTKSPSGSQHQAMVTGAIFYFSVLNDPHCISLAE